MRSFTPEQQAAIDRREGPLLLSANAGSGKTSVLVERLVAAVLEDGIPPAQLLAITFTEKAAGELRARARSRLSELGERVAAREIERAQVSTIHGFCSGVLRANAVAAGLDPAFTVLASSTTRELRARAFDTALAELLQDPADGALDLVAAWGPDRLRDAVEAVHEALRSQGQTVPRLPPPRPRHTVAAALTALRGPTDAFTEELRNGRTGVKTVDAARDALGGCHELLGAQTPPSRGQLDALKIARGAKELKTETCRAWVEAVESLGEALDDAEATADHALLDALLTAFARAYTAGKRAFSGVDYDDLQLLVRDLLRDRPEVRAAHAERFTRIMVDEFQDTNALQLELIEHLDTGHTFLVGDQLQSIYGFRHADVALFRAQRAAHAAREQAAVLATNWRSHPELLGTINGAWGAVVHDGYVPLVAGRTDPVGEQAPRTELLVTSTAWDEPGLDTGLADELGTGMPSGVKASKLAEARAIARRVRALVDAGECREEETVVLVRAASDLHVFARALEREGFATLAGGGRGYWLRQPVQDLTSYLGALVNPRDERALFGTLASPLCGLSSDALAHVAAAAREQGDAWRAVRSVTLARRLSGADAAALEAFLIRFGLERTTAARFGLDELIERAVVQSGYDLHVLRLPGGRRRLANVHKLQRLAAAYEEDHGRDVRGFIDHAQAEAEADVREADAPVELSGEPAIRLMTIHAAKGLEFGVVVVADLGRKTRAEAGDLLVEGDRLGLRLLRLGLPPRVALDHAELVGRAGEAAAAEERRILHVAFTRAEERLILSGVAPVGEGWPRRGSTASPLSWIGPQLDEQLLARLPAEPVLTLDQDAGHGRVRVIARLVDPETAPETLGLSAPPPPGAQLGFFATPADLPNVASASPSEGHPAFAAGGDAAGRLLAGAAGDAEAGRLFAAGLTGALTDPAVGLEARAVPGAAVPIAAPVATLSYSSLTAHARCGYRFYLERILGLPESEPPPAGPAAGLDPRARGSIAHLVLEQLDPTRPVLPDRATVQAMGSRFDAEVTQEEADEVLALLDGFVQASPLLARLRAARRVRVEAGFTLPLPNDDAPLLTGFLDVFVEEADGGVLVVDWKSDRLHGTEPEVAMGEAYATQRAVYALAALGTGAVTVEVVHAFLERPDHPVGVHFTQDDVPGLWAQVLAGAAPLLASRYPVSDAPHLGLCSGCPGRGSLCVHPVELTERDAP